MSQLSTTASPHPVTGTDGSYSSTVDGTAYTVLEEAITALSGLLIDYKGLWFGGVCATGMSASRTSITLDTLTGFGNDCFNYVSTTPEWYMYCLRNANSAGAAPTGELVAITDYVTGTGVFTLAGTGFSANAEASDTMIIVHESIAKLFDAYVSSGIVNNFDGNLMEVLKAGLEKTTSGAFDPDTDSNEVISESIGVPISQQVNNLTARTTLKALLNDLNAVVGCDGTNVFNPSIGGSNRTTVEAAFEALGALLSYIVVGSGTFTTSSATVPADTGQGSKADDYYNDCILVPLTGSAALQPRRIYDFTTSTGVFTLDTSTPFTAATGAVNYVILADAQARQELAALQADIGDPSAASTTLYDQVKILQKVAVDGSNAPVANTLSDIIHKDASYTYDNTTDSLEAIRDRVDAINTSDLQYIRSADIATPTAGSLADIADKLYTAADGTDAYPASVATDSAMAKLMAKGNPAAITTFDNTTDSLEAISDAVAAVNTDLGNYSGQTNLQSLLAALGIPDTAGKPLYTCLITDRLDSATYGLSALNTDLDNIILDTKYISTTAIGSPTSGSISDVVKKFYLTSDGTDVYPASVINDSALAKILSKGDPAAVTSYNNTTDSLEALRDKLDTMTVATGAGVAQMAATTESLNQAASTYDLFTGTTQAVQIESVTLKLPTGAVGGAVTSLSIQTDDATPTTFLDSTMLAVANLTSERNFSWTGSHYLAVGKKVQLTISGGAHGSAYDAIVVVKYRSIVAGGTLTA